LMVYSFSLSTHIEFGRKFTYGPSRLQVTELGQPHPIPYYDIDFLVIEVSVVGISSVQLRPSWFNSSRRLSGALQNFLSPWSVACPLHAALAPSFKRCLPSHAFYISHSHVGIWMTSKACTPSRSLPFFGHPMQSASPPFNALALLCCDIRSKASSIPFVCSFSEKSMQLVKTPCKLHVPSHALFHVHPCQAAHPCSINRNALACQAAHADGPLTGPLAAPLAGLLNARAPWLSGVLLMLSTSYEETICEGGGFLGR